jgi:hypothetical protein
LADFFKNCGLLGVTRYPLTLARGVRCAAWPLIYF